MRIWCQNTLLFSDNRLPIWGHCNRELHIIFLLDFLYPRCPFPRDLSSLPIAGKTAGSHRQWLPPLHNTLEQSAHVDVCVQVVYVVTRCLKIENWQAISSRNYFFSILVKTLWQNVKHKLYLSLLAIACLVTLCWL